MYSVHHQLETWKQRETWGYIVRFDICTSGNVAPEWISKLHIDWNVWRKVCLKFFLEHRVYCQAGQELGRVSGPGCKSPIALGKTNGIHIFHAICTSIMGTTWKRNARRGYKMTHGHVGSYSEKHRKTKGKSTSWFLDEASEHAVLQEEDIGKVVACSL
jgi:hypothetical protein